MNQRLAQFINLIGIIFMIVSTVMFYNHLLTASGNPYFFIDVYFDMYGEGALELFLFTLFVPFILFTIVYQFYQFYVLIKRQKYGNKTNRRNCST